MSARRTPAPPSCIELVSPDRRLAAHAVECPRGSRKSLYSHGLPRLPLVLLMRRRALLSMFILALLAFTQRGTASCLRNIQTVDATTRAAFEQQGLSGMGLASRLLGQPGLRQMYGDFSADRRIRSRLPRSRRRPDLLRLVDQERLSLDLTMGQVLGWKGPQGEISLKHLLSFTSGLPPRDACTLRPGISLADCVNSLSNSSSSPRRARASTTAIRICMSRRVWLRL